MKKLSQFLTHMEGESSNSNFFHKNEKLLIFFYILVVVYQKLMLWLLKLANMYLIATINGQKSQTYKLNKSDKFIIKVIIYI